MFYDTASTWSTVLLICWQARLRCVIIRGLPPPGRITHCSLSLSVRPSVCLFVSYMTGTQAVWIWNVTPTTPIWHQNAETQVVHQASHCSDRHEMHNNNNWQKVTTTTTTTGTTTTTTRRRRLVPSSIWRVGGAQNLSALSSVFSHSCCIVDGHTRPFTDVMCPSSSLSTATSTTRCTTLYHFLFNTAVLPYNVTVVTHLCRLWSSF